MMFTIMGAKRLANIHVPYKHAFTMLPIVGSPPRPMEFSALNIPGHAKTVNDISTSCVMLLE